MSATAPQPLVFQPRRGNGVLFARLSRRVAGEVLFDAASRGRYAIEAILADGTEARFGPESEMRNAGHPIGDIVDRLAAIGERERDEIALQVPKQLRRVGGYNIDIFHPQSERPYTADGSVNFAHLLVGSEGTLAWTRALELDVVPLPRHRALGVVNFPTLHRAMECARHLVTLAPTAV